MEEVEIWKSLDFIGFPDYEVSNFGRVKSLNYKRSGKEDIMKPCKNSIGYLIVCLRKPFKSTKTVHRLVALAFLENPYNLPCVNHKDENKENNHVDNLEFCDIRYNNSYGTRNERASKNISKAKKGKPLTEEHKRKMSEAHIGKKLSKEHKQKLSCVMKGKNNKPILQYTKEGIFIRKWDSITIASKELNIDCSSISKVCKNQLKTCGGYIWRFK